MKIGVLAVLLCSAGAARAQDVTAALRGGVYADSDRTQVIRSLAAVGASWSHWHLSAQEAVDIVSSASVDVRSSPFLDTVSGASVSMSDRRFETTLGASVDDDHGHTGGATLVYATERDYVSVGGGLSGTIDLSRTRDTTLIGAVHVNHNSVSSTIDDTFVKTLTDLGYTVGLAQVLSPDDVLRVRYDGEFLDGYQASPYRAVRFGDWMATNRPREDGLVFSNTLGNPDGYAETLPETRVRHALVVEWVHALGDALAVETQVRGAVDSWSVRGLTAGVDLRMVQPRWLARVGYRFYVQSPADFFQDKYLQDMSHYEYFTADKELGDEVGHVGSVDVAYLFRDRARGRPQWQVDAKGDIIYYTYPGFPLLSSRTSVFVELGLRSDF